MPTPVLVRRHLFLARREDEVEYDLGWALNALVYRCRPVCDISGKTNEFRQTDSHESQVISRERMRRLLE